VQPEEGCVGSCAEAGVLGAVPGIFGAIQAMEALKLLLDLPGALNESILLYDLLSHGSSRLRAPRRKDCLVCGDAPRGEAPPARSEGYVDIDAATALGTAGWRVVDLSEPHERAAWPVGEPKPLCVPMSRFDLDAPPFGRDERVVLCCARGVRSRSLASALRRRGYSGVYSLRGGIRSLGTEASGPSTGA
jgi:adenylyltransferase/sulfurtransferase